MPGQVVDLQDMAEYLYNGFCSLECEDNAEQHCLFCKQGKDKCVCVTGIGEECSVCNGTGKNKTGDGRCYACTKESECPGGCGCAATLCTCDQSEEFPTIIEKIFVIETEVYCIKDLSFVKLIGKNDSATIPIQFIPNLAYLLYSETRNSKHVLSGTAIKSFTINIEFEIVDKRRGKVVRIYDKDEKSSFAVNWPCQPEPD
jgi:hypothetical protein